MKYLITSLFKFYFKKRDKNIVNAKKENLFLLAIQQWSLKVATAYLKKFNIKLTDF